ncbi:hypothetical protein MPDQ_002010 [Monascus purpureus]|uniref:Uncharacterized protein n=1 Tax=Monascus purpureus TaxID=5098 RepID=A0A507R467_MONPU|nr:hypothetical protein MPDQ_002010 [Monascus purpureus]
MKSYRILYQKILGFFHLLPPPPAGHPDKPKPRGPVLLSTSPVAEEKKTLPPEGPARLSAHSDSDSGCRFRPTRLLSREELEARIVELWRTLDRRFWRCSENKGIAGLKLYAHLSVSTLESVVELLEAYACEIDSLNDLYKILREEQVDVWSSPQGSSAYRRYMDVAEPLAKNLCWYDVRMAVLDIEIYDEAMALHADDPKLQKGWYIYDKAFPGSGEIRGC